MPRQDGDRDELICNHCEALRECEYSYGPYDYEGETIEDVFRSVCLTCGNVVTIDARSTYRLAEVKSRKAQRRTSVSLPIEMQDQIASDLMRAGSNWSHAELYFRAMLVACHDDPEAAAKLVVEVQDDILGKPNKARLNVCLGKQLTETLDKIAEASGIRNTSEIIRRLVVLTRGPIRVPFLRELRSLALAYV